MVFPSKILEGISENNPMNKLSLALDNLAKTKYPLCETYKKSVFPDMANAVELAQDKVYRINVPGYFYRFSPKSSGFTSAESGLVIADTYNQIMHFYKDKVPVVYPDESGNYVEASSDYVFTTGEGMRIKAIIDTYNEVGSSGQLIGSALNWIDVNAVVYQKIKNFDFISGALPAYTDYNSYTYEDKSTEANPGFLYLFNKYLGFSFDDPRYQGIYGFSSTVDPTYGGTVECGGCCGAKCEPYLNTGPIESYCFNSPTCLSGVENASENYNFDKRSYFISTGKSNHTFNNMIPILPGESTHCSTCYMAHENSSFIYHVGEDYVWVQKKTGHGYITKDSIGSFVYWYRDKETSADEVKYYFVPVKGQTTFEQSGNTLKVKPITCVGALVTKVVTNSTTKKNRALPIRVNYVKQTGKSAYQICNVLTYSRDKKTGNPTRPYGYSELLMVTSDFSGKPPFETYDSSNKISFKKTPFKNASYNFDDDENIVGLKTIFITEMYDRQTTHIDGTYELPYHVTNTPYRFEGHNVNTPTPVAFVPYLDDENPYSTR